MSPVPAPGSLVYGWRAFSPDLHVSRMSLILIVNSSLPEVVCFCGKVPMLTFVYRWTASSTVVYELKHGINSISHVISRETVLTTVAALLT